MHSFVNYILESAISLGTLALVYFFFLRKETFFRLNRYFLLLSVIFSALLPILHLQVYEPTPTMLDEVTVSQYRNLIEVVTIYSTNFSGSIERFILSYKFLGIVYVGGIIVFTFLLLWRIIQVAELIQNNKVEKLGKIKVVRIDRDFSPFSFMNYVFVSKNIKGYEDWDKMLSHEIEHIKQGHSMDVMIIEFLAILQWFNPFFWMLRRALRENHEFSADQAVVSKGVSRAGYKRILINQFVGDQLIIASSFNYSLVKNRVKMLSRLKSSRKSKTKFVLGILMAASLIVAFACEKKESGPSKEIQKEFHFISISENLLNDPAYKPEIEHAKELLKSARNLEAIVDSLEGTFEVELNDGILYLNRRFNQQKAVYIVDGDLADISYVEGLDKESFKAINVIKDGEELNSYIERYGAQAREGVVLCYLESIPAKLDSSTDKINLIDEIITFSPKSEEDEVFFIVEQMPEFPGDELALRNYISNSIIYPESSVEKGIQGKVYVSFVVSKAGMVTKARVVRGVDPQIDREALRVIKTLPKWKPGMQNDKAVNVAYTVPINFKLQ